MRNADRPNPNAQSNAERQRRYRDRKRGGPARGRWFGTIPTKLTAKSMGCGRTLAFQARWIVRHAPDFISPIERGEQRVSTIYARLKSEYDSVLIDALRKGFTPERLAVVFIHGRFEAFEIPNDDSQ